MAVRCGLDEASLLETARDFAAAESAAVFYDLGVEQTHFSTLISYLIRVLVVLTGNAGRPGGCVFLENFLPPLQDPTRVNEPERALASGIPAIRALGNAGMFSPTLLPEEILVDHPERVRAVIVEGANPILSYSDAPRWREARERLDLLVVIDPAMTETARLADFVLPVPVGYEKWETAAFPRGAPEIFMQVRPPVVPPPTDVLPEPEIYVRLAEAMGLFGDPPAELFDLAKEAHTPDGAMAFLATAQTHATLGDNQALFWAYRTLGPLLPAPSLSGIWVIANLNGLFRPTSVVRALGEEWASASPFALGSEIFRRVLAHPEGVEIARQSLETNLEDHIGFADKKIRLAIPAMLEEMDRALVSKPAVDPDYPLVLAAGLRTRWTANTIQRDPGWRKGRGPHCALNLSPADADALGIRDGDTVRVSTRRGALTMPAQVDGKLLAGHVWMPNGFGMISADGHAQGANQNELTDVGDRDPFTGIPYHRYVRCRVERSDSPHP
jgi:anaerobic selenocysteine-containing dehydrogenase